MSKHLTRRMVPLADIGFADSARDWFVRRPCESRAAFEQRLFALQPDDAPKARKYARAMARGAEFPPVFLVRLAGEVCDQPAAKGAPGSALRAAYRRRCACEAAIEAAIASVAPNVVRFPMEMRLSRSSI